ncbi:EAL domain-containing protein [Aeromonas sp. NJAU223]|uniref:EAL domain-containing protein n=1 Tax=Aeromonas sp. NJAU223 TaxID=3115650 RepID=UPI003DA97E41
MSKYSSFWILLALLLTPLLLVAALSPLLITPISRYLLTNKEQELRAYQNERTQVLNESVRTQLASFKFDCGPTDMALLRDPAYYSRHIRFAGIHTANGKSCSTMGPGLAILEDIKDLPNGQNYSVTATSGAFGTEQETLIYSKRNGNLAYWALDSSWAHELMQSPCPDCFYLEFSHMAPAREHLYFPRGNAAIKTQPDKLSVSSFDQRNKVDQTLSAGNELRHYVAMKLRDYGLPSAILLGLLLTLAYWLLRNYRNSLSGLLKLGLQRREFIPFYQPIVDSRTQEVVGYEALIRWQRGKGFISPAMFIDYAEQQGLIVPITEQLVLKVVDDLAHLPPPRWVSVNLVADHLEQRYLLDMLAKVKWPSPDRLTFELTERLPITNIKVAAREIAKLGLRGYHFKIDDFGTGYGGFAYLQQLGIRSIKIDKMFVDTIGTQDFKRTVLDAIIAFGHESKMEMIAEGVENQAQLDYLTKHGVYLIQGYVYAKPMPLEEALAWNPQQESEPGEIKQA